MLALDSHVRNEDDYRRYIKEFEEVVEEEINQVKEEVKAIEGELSHKKEDAKPDKKEMNKKMEDLETKFRQLSTTGVIKAEGTVTTPSKVKEGGREEDKATSIIAALRGEALEVLRTIPEGSQDSATSALEKIYGGAHLQHLRNRKQRFEETLQQYEADVSQMINLAYPTASVEVIEQLSVSSFVEGLRDPEIGQLVRLARHKTIFEALAHALEIEAVKEASRVASNLLLNTATSTDKGKALVPPYPFRRIATQAQIASVNRKRDRTEGEDY
ncbi:hypothetical protein NQ315_000565 [Exocentrus adspersus]|uniref:Uncharacterized protein n=1 Tax=Exocentrus adspersus TaxID=1586481 RepID=A0AAV8VFV5_9CUCU|nr:hypothetical protein NQ315_000565 [Exocentrus adspersus]